MNGPITEIQSMLSNGLSQILIAGGPRSCIDSSQSDRINKDYRAFSGRVCSGAWHGGDENLPVGQSALYRRASCNGAASLGKYTQGMELETADEPARRHDWRDD